MSIYTALLLYNAILVLFALLFVVMVGARALYWFFEWYLQFRNRKRGHDKKDKPPFSP
jgi:hypothetical protein